MKTRRRSLPLWVRLSEALGGRWRNAMKVEFSKEWCMSMAKAEDGHSVDVGPAEPETKAIRVACILEQAAYKPGDQAPEGYLAWHEWAEVQHKAGLRQKQCGRCGLWRFPQQMSATVDRTEETGLRKLKPFRRTLEAPVCNDCDKTPNVLVSRQGSADE